MVTEIKSPKRLSKNQWQALITEQQNSTASQAEFCRSKGLCLATFYNWKRKLASNQTQAEAPPQWVELPTSMDTASSRIGWDIELELPGNVILRMRQ